MLLMMVVVVAMMGSGGGPMGMMGHDRPALEAHGQGADDSGQKMSAPTEEEDGDVAGAPSAAKRP